MLDPTSKSTPRLPASVLREDLERWIKVLEAASRE